MEHLELSNDYTNFQSKLLGMATVSSFVSATWGGADRFSNKAWGLWGFIELGPCTLPIVNLIYTTFFLIFIPKVILEWRLGIRIPLRMEYACVGLALSAQLVAIVLTNVANPDETIWSDWGVIYSLSVISLIALSTYSTSVLFGVWSKRDSTHMSFKQPLLPFRFDNQPGNSKYGC